VNEYLYQDSLSHLSFDCAHLPFKSGEMCAHDYHNHSFNVNEIVNGVDGGLEERRKNLRWMSKDAFG
jgi:hypothetical protein